MFQYHLILSYDGTRYFGWQKTRSGPSIQEMVEKAVLQIQEIAPLPEAASRTDRGVHAEGQSIALVLKKKWEPTILQKALNNSLPLDIRILTVKAVPLDFHPTLHAIEKEYHYSCCLSSVQQPIYRLYSWHFYHPLDLNKMEMGAQMFLGAHDFSAFANTRKKASICTLSRIHLLSLPENRLRISLVGNRFLYKMARNIVGALLYIGCGKLTPDQVPLILASKQRTKAAVTAPAHGLILHRIEYGPSLKD